MKKESKLFLSSFCETSTLPPDKHLSTFPSISTRKWTIIFSVILVIMPPECLTSVELVDKFPPLPSGSWSKKSWCHNGFQRLLKFWFWQPCHTSQGLLNWMKCYSNSTKFSIQISPCLSAPFPSLLHVLAITSAYPLGIITEPQNQIFEAHSNFFGFCRPSPLLLYTTGHRLTSWGSLACFILKFHIKMELIGSYFSSVSIQIVLG